MELNENEKRFCEEYVNGFTVKEAAMCANLSYPEARKVLLEPRSAKYISKLREQKKVDDKVADGANF